MVGYGYILALKKALYSNKNTFHQKEALIIAKSPLFILFYQFKIGITTVEEILDVQ